MSGLGAALGTRGGQQAGLFSDAVTKARLDAPLVESRQMAGSQRPEAEESLLSFWDADGRQ